MRVRVARYPIAWLRVLDAPHTFSLFSGPAVTSRSCVLASRVNEILDVITSKRINKVTLYARNLPSFVVRVRVWDSSKYLVFKPCTCARLLIVN